MRRMWFSHPLTVDRDPISGQVIHHPAAVAAGILQIQSINPGHDPERGFTHRARRVRER